MVSIRNQIANLTDEQILEYVEGKLELPIRMGFELEFHAVDGKTRDDFSGGCHGEHDYDWDAIHEEATSRYNREFYRFIHNEVAEPHCAHKSGYLLLEIINQAILNNWDGQSRYRPSTLIEWIEYSANADIVEKIEQLLEELEEDWVQEWIENADLSSFQEECDCMTEPMEAMEEYMYIPDGCELKHDGSVDGGEITSKGPNTVVDLLQLTELIFANNDLDIDAGCSYHLHFSIEGIKHSYGQHVQAEAMVFLNKSLIEGLWPSALVDRLGDMNYYKPLIQQDKYSMLHFNAGYKTWEFRIFGNISNIADAKACYILAIKAMRHVYRVLEGMVPSLRSRIAEIANIDKGNLSLSQIFCQDGCSLFRWEEPLTIEQLIEACRAPESVDEDTNNVA